MGNCFGENDEQVHQNNFNDAIMLQCFIKSSNQPLKQLELYTHPAEFIYESNYRPFSLAKITILDYQYSIQELYETYQHKVLTLNFPFLMMIHGF